MKDWFGCLIPNDQITLGNFFDECATGSFENEPVEEKEHRTFAKVFGGNSKKREMITQVSPTDKTDVTLITRECIQFSYQLMSKLVLIGIIAEK